MPTERDQALQACEIAHTGLSSNSAEVLLWFTTQVLKRPPSWASVVGQALLDKNKLGVLRWKEAKNPLGLLNTISRRIALKTSPELLGLPEELNSRSLPATPLSQLPDSVVASFRSTQTEGVRPSSQEVMDKAFYRYEKTHGDDYEEPSITEDIEDGFVLEGTSSEARSFDWNAIGERLGFSADLIELLKARSIGVPRAHMASYLSWPSEKVERVWRSFNRLLDDPQTAARAREQLLQKNFD